MCTVTYVQCRFATHSCRVIMDKFADRLARFATVFGSAYLCIRIGMGLFSA